VKIAPGNYRHMPPSLPISALTLAALAVINTLHASPVTWQAPFNLTNVNGISTAGTPVRAVNATTDASSPVVTVGTEAITFEPVSLGPLGVGTGTYFTGDGGDTGDVNLNTVLNSHVWGGAEWSFSLAGLTAGKNYQIQLIGAGDTRSCCSARNQRGGDGEAVESVSADFSRSGVGSVIGTFTASGPTQTIRVLPGLVNGTDPGLSGYVLRELTPPTPQAPADIALSNALIAPGSGAGLVIGTLTATDANAVDTHTFSLTDSAGFPDNSHFTISGGQLRAAASVGAPGTVYQIRVRATDSTSLTYDETLALTVQQAQAPSALTFSATTIQTTTPAGGLAGTFATVDATVADAHIYTLVAGTGSTDNTRFTIAGDELRLATSLPAAGGTVGVRVRTTDLAGLFVENTFTLPVIDTSLRINEFLADNTAATLADENLDTPDWIELHNPSAAAINLSGWRLTDDPSSLAKWVFPAVTIPAGGYRIIFASGKNRTPLTGNLHTNFSLDSAGDYVALVSPGGTVMSEFGTSGANYPPQRAGVSYGLYGSPLQIGFMRTPTPNALNNSASGVLGFVADTKFSVDRGFFSSAFDLTITTTTPGATIRYTTNGSWPSETAGTIYTSPIPISRSQPVKAVAYLAGHLSTNVDTHTYIFVDEVVTQTAASVQSVNGLPATWNGNAVYYGMNGNSAVVNPATHATLKNDLKTVPSLSISIDTNDMFGTSGIYSNPTSSGAAWERKTSLELIDPAAPDGSRDFQENCVIQIQGGAFRGFGLTRKKSFRVTFKPDFGTSNLPTGGPGRLNYPLFGPGAAQSFNTFTLRMESNDGWQWSGAGGKPQYARDQFARRAMQELGQPASEGRYLHLYINGVYWGIYNVVERPDASFAESYLGADPALWQGQNSGQPINGATNIAEWSSMLAVVDDITPAATNALKDAEYLQSAGFNADGTRNAAFPIWIDPTNFADYLIVNWYAGNSDWPFKNYYGGRAREANSTGYKFFMWDCEWSLLLQSSPTTNRTGDFSGIAAPQGHLEKSPEYRVRYADRAFRAMFNNGPLTPPRARAIYDEVTAQHRSILIPESARWGNQHGGQYGVSHWQSEYNNIVNTWFPVRTANFLSQLRARGLYPFIDAPIYSQHGGSVPAGGSITMTVPSTVSKIYYQFGSGDADPADYAHSLDPRLVGGGIHPSSTLIDLGGGGGPVTTFFVMTGAVWKYLADGSDQGTAWRAPGFNDAAWPSGPSQLGYADSDEATVVPFVDADPVTAGVQKNATTYFRRVVDIPNPATFADFTLNFTYDDGIVIYLNGSPVARQFINVDAPYNQYATGSGGENAAGTVTLPPSAFVAGANTFAAEVKQDSGASSDISFDLTLTGNPPGGSGARTTPPITLPNHGWLFSRSYESTTGTWSALNSAFFTIATVPADATNLVISEMNYHPSEPPAGAVSTDRDDYEYIELKNVLSASSVDMTGVTFTAGITFEFAANTLIPPGGRVVIVKNRAAFEQRYAAQLAGVSFAFNADGTAEYTGRLSNDGELVTLLGATGTPIVSFTYDENLPWPPVADGLGYSLVLKHPSTPPPDHALPESWVAGRTANGAPGADDPFGFAGDPAADLDLDGFSALIEFGLGSSDTIPGDPAQSVNSVFTDYPAGAGTDQYLTITFRRNLLAHHTLELRPEVSGNLTTWAGGAAVEFISETDHGDGTSTVVYRSASPVSGTVRQFVRLLAAPQP
jgi:hypothetical protein